jgi:hypothetical protein
LETLVPNTVIGTLATSFSRARGLGLPGLPGGISVLYPTANSGYINSSNNATTEVDAYSYARSGVTGAYIPVVQASTTSNGQIGQALNENLAEGGIDGTVNQTFLEFDTALAIPSMGILSATLSLYFVVKIISPGGDFNINILQYPYGTSLTSADYVGGDSLPPSYFSYISTTSISAASSATIYAAPFANPSGKTQLLLYSSNTQANSIPALNTSENVSIALQYTTLTVNVDF